NPHTEAEAAVKALQKSECDMPTGSLVGKDSHTVEHGIGSYNAGDRMQFWGTLGALWGGWWGLLCGSACGARGRGRYALGAHWGPCGAGGGAGCAARPALREAGHVWHCDTWCVISALSAF